MYKAGAGMNRVSREESGTNFISGTLAILMATVLAVASTVQAVDLT